MQDPTKWLDLIRGEFQEMPGMTLTPAQASRLWGIEEAVCVELLEHLTSTGFLKRTADGSYCRNLEGHRSRA